MFRIETILGACQNNELILTPNQRLRSKALHAWGVYQQALKHKVWCQPRIYTLEQWLQHCWQQLQHQVSQYSAILIASADQERVLWEKITADCGLMRPEVLAKAAANGLTSLEKWQLTPNHLSAHSSDEGIALYIQWCQRFKTLLKKHGMISRTHSYHLIGEAFSHGTLSQEAIIHLLAFDDIPPLLHCQLNKASTQLTHVNLHDYQPQSINKVHCRDTKTEMNAAAEWAKQQLTQSISQQNPVRIGIIVPNLGQCRHAIERALINSFEGHSLLGDTPRYTLPFNISAGTPLGDTPLISDALQLLKLHQHKWPIDQLCQLLFSPFWGQLSQENDQRYSLATWLQAQGLFEIHLSEVLYQMEKCEIEKDDDQKQKLFKQFSALRTHQYKYKDRQAPSVWVTVFLEQLALMQWPGERQPDSHEYQQTQLWYQLLERFAGLDSTLGNIYCTEALDQLQRMSNHEPFQAQVPDSPIQVLGMLEGAGLHFTHCWVMGLHQHNWPPAPAPNPLLPLKLQREHNMPHATSLRELAFAESLSQHYRHCADHIIVSYPQYDPDNEQALQASVLIDTIPEMETSTRSHLLDHQSDFDRYLLAQRQNQSFEWVNCAQGPAVTQQDLNENGELPGGTGILKAQATNPFDAFARYRLKAAIPTTAVIGFSPMEKGNILHQSMATLWQQLKTQKTLLDTDTLILDDMVNSAVEHEIQGCRRGKRHHLGDYLCQIEKERQVALILRWLEFEKKRPYFTVKAIEESCNIQLHGTTIKLRIDRVDQLADGSYLILDYKTGNSTTGDWQGQRPRDPQLPLYLIAAHHEPACGIAFAQINIRKQTLIGLHNGKYPGQTLSPIGDNRYDLPKDWQTVKIHWQQVVETLLHDFLSGYCTVDYRDKLSMNDQQQLLALNRYFDHYRVNFFL